MYHVNHDVKSDCLHVSNHSLFHTYERPFEQIPPVLMISDIMMLICNFKSQQQTLMIDELTYGVKNACNPMVGAIHPIVILRSIV